MSNNQRKSNSKKKKTTNRSGVIGWALALCAVVGFGALVYFAPWQGSEGDEQGNDPPPEHVEEYVDIAFHFPNADGIMNEEIRQIEVRANLDMVYAILTGLQEGPQRADLLNVFPAGVVVAGHNYLPISSVVRVTFSQEFEDILLSERIILIGSIVYTLTELDFVEHLEFFVGDNPLLDGNGELFGQRNRGNTFLDTTFVPPTASIVLYFPNEQMTGLVAETRVIPFDSLIDNHAEAIVNALLQGPERSDLFAAIPTDTAVLSVHTSGDLASVSFTSDFINAISGSSSTQTFAIFSLVNSLTAQSGIRNVQILIDGLRFPYDDGVLDIDISQPISRDEDLILRGQ